MAASPPTPGVELVEAGVEVGLRVQSCYQVDTDACRALDARLREAVPVLLSQCAETSERCLSLVAHVAGESGARDHPTIGGNDGGASAGWYQLQRWHLARCRAQGLEVDPHDLASATRCVVQRIVDLSAKASLVCPRITGDPWPYALRAFGLGRWEGCRGRARTRAKERCYKVAVRKAGEPARVCTTYRATVGGAGPVRSKYWTFAAHVWRALTREAAAPARQLARQDPVDAVRSRVQPSFGNPSSRQTSR